MAYEAWHLVITMRDVAAGVLLRYPAPACALMQRIRDAAGMVYLAAPISLYAEGQDKAWGPGVTVLMPLQDSHMSLHCLELERAVFFDLFSCRQADFGAVVQTLRLAFGGSGHATLYDRVGGREDRTWAWGVNSG